MNRYLIIGAIISLLAVGFMINHMPLLGAILLIIGASIGLKGRNKLDRDNLKVEDTGKNKKRSRGVTIFGILLILFSLLRFPFFGYHYTIIHRLETKFEKEISSTIKEQAKEAGREKLYEELLQIQKKWNEKVKSMREDFKRTWTRAFVAMSVLLLTAISILRLKNWGRILAIILSIFYLICGPLDIYDHLYHLIWQRHLCENISPFHFYVEVLGYIVKILYYIFCILLLYFLTRPKVKEQFK